MDKTPRVIHSRQGLNFVLLTNLICGMDHLSICPITIVYILSSIHYNKIPIYDSLDGVTITVEGITTNTACSCIF